MVGEVQNVGHLVIARRAGGEPVELVRSPEEVVFLGFDSRIKRLVELHVLRSGTTLDSVAKRSAFDRARRAMGIRGAAFMRVLDVGEDKGLVYYTTNLNDGEFVQNYTARRGPFPASTALCLVFQLLDDLIQLDEHRWLVEHMRLDRVAVSTLEDTFLQLRVYDYGLSACAEPEGEGDARMVVQACRLIFLMLTGKECAGDNPDRYPALAGLPMNLRTTIRSALTDPANAPGSLERLREDVREAYGALVSSIQARSSRRQLVVTPALQPRSQLQDLLLENVPVEVILGNRFRVEDAENVRRYPFSIPCVNSKNDQPVTVHLLPPSRIVDKAQYEAVPLQTWRFDGERHPNILRSLSLWESPDWTFLTEEREPGFTVSRLMAERICLNPSEVLVVIRQVCAGMEQALECGVQRVDLHPSNIVLRVGKAGPLLNREYERLMQKRLDAWPHFLVKLRAHLTMRNLYEPLLVEPPDEGEHPEVHLADRDYRHRAFVTLAAYLLTGERQTTSAARFPEALPEPLVALMRGTLEKTRKVGLTPNPAEFLEAFETSLTAPVLPDLATRLRGVVVPMEEMESMGSISDFDNEWDRPGLDLLDDAETAGPVARALDVAHLNHSKRRRPAWPVWAAAAAVILAMGSWWQFSNRTHKIAAFAGTSGEPVINGSTPVEEKVLPVEPDVAEEPVIVSGPAAFPPTMVRKSGATEPAAVRDDGPPPQVFATLQPPPKAETQPMTAFSDSAPVVEASPAAMEIAAASPAPSPGERPEDEPAPSSELLKPGQRGVPIMAEIKRATRVDEPVVATEPERQAAAASPGNLATNIRDTAESSLSADWQVAAVAPVLPPIQGPTLEAMTPARQLTSVEPRHEGDSVAALPETVPVKPEPFVAAALPAATPAPSPSGAELPQGESKAPDPVIIRRAIMPSAEEIAKFKENAKEAATVRRARDVQEAPPSPKRQLSRR